MMIGERNVFHLARLVNAIIIYQAACIHSDGSIETGIAAVNMKIEGRVISIGDVSFLSNASGFMYFD